MFDRPEIPTFVIHTIALGGFISVGKRLWVFRASDGPVLDGLIDFFLGAGLFWVWLWLGYLERVTDFWPGLDVLSSVTRPWIGIPIFFCLICPLYRLSEALDGRRR